MSNNRSKGRNNCQVKTKQFFNKYLENAEKTSLINDENIITDKKLFNVILNEINQSIIDAIIFENYEFRIPFRIGYIRIQKKKNTYNKRRLKVNWKKTKALWEENEKAKQEKKLIYHLNEHTNGYYYKFYFSKFTSNLKNKSAYSFIPSRDNQRMLARHIKNNGDNVDYYE